MASRAFIVEDLWTPDQPLPSRRTLVAIARRCGSAWECSDLHRRVTIIYNQRLETTLGRAILDEDLVELNVRLLQQHPAELVPTLAHELAHLVVHRRYGRVPPHGLHFRALMRAVNLSPEATHDLPVARRRARKYLYLHVCSRCGRTFIDRRVRRDCYCTACGPRMEWDVLRAPNSRAGLAALKRAQAAVLRRRRASRASPPRKRTTRMPARPTVSKNRSRPKRR